MIKLKDVLFEGKEPENAPVKDAVVEQLHEELRSNNWIVREPFIYRARGWDGQFKKKDSEVYDKRKTRDTGDTMDYLFHDFIMSCHPDYPDRRQSRFAGPDKWEIEDIIDYGEHTYIIFPHKGAKIASATADSYVYFVEEYNHELERGLSYFFKKGGLEDVEDKIQNRTIDLLKRLAKVEFENKEVDIFGEFGCMKNILYLLSSAEQKFSPEGEYKNKVVEEAFQDIKKIFSVSLNGYFDTLSKGYPDTRSEGRGEVIYQGEYLQVHEEVWSEYKRKYGKPSMKFHKKDRGDFIELELRKYTGEDLGWYDEDGNPYIKLGECDVVDYEYRKKMFDLEEFDPPLREDAFGIENLEVLDENRGKGYGRMLVERALEIGMERYNTLKVDIIAEDQAFRFFEKIINENESEYDFKFWYVDYDDDEIYNVK